MLVGVGSPSRGNGWEGAADNRVQHRAEHRMRPAERLVRMALRTYVVDGFPALELSIPKDHKGGAISRHTKWLADTVVANGDIDKD